MNPFTLARPQPGHGEVHLSALPPSSVAVRTLRYTYPLKLILSAPHVVDVVASGSADKAATLKTKVPLLFMLSYGGGLLPPDVIHLSVTLEAQTRLTLATQGSTKVFPSPPRDSKPGQFQDVSGPFVASQTLKVDIGPDASLLLSPDPVQPFKDSHYSQLQIFNVHAGSSLCFLDWVSSGRPARGEVWDAGSWRGRNEVWREQEDNSAPTSGGDANLKRRLLLRDAVFLADGPSGVGQSTLKHESKGVFGTIALLGPLFDHLAAFFMDEFTSQPRHGAQKWDDDEDNDAAEQSPLLKWRAQRLEMERANDVMWTAARVRGIVVVKFAARQVEGAKAWLRSMFEQEGTVEREFGPGGLMSVR